MVPVHLVVSIAHLLGQAGKDVTILARGQRHHFIKANGLLLEGETTGTSGISKVQAVDELRGGDDYDLVVVLIRKNKLPPVLEGDIIKSCV